MRLSTSFGRGSRRDGFPGTVYVPDTTFYPYEFLAGTCRIIIPGATNWAGASLTVSNAWVLFPDAWGFTVTNDVRITGASAKLDITNSVLNCGGDLTVTNGGVFNVYCGPTNAASPEYGSLVSVAGAFVVAATSTVNLYSHPTNGGSASLRVRDLTVAAGGRINADTNGYMSVAGTNGLGPGHGIVGLPSFVGSGGGYGGRGGNSSESAGGATYGSSNAPVDPGSAGSGWYGPPTTGGMGGGAVRVAASGNVLIDGTVTANGGSDPLGGSGYGGGGSGGGVYIRARTFGGGGSISAKGGNGGAAGGSYSGGGGGGRIAVWRGNTNTVAVVLGGGTGSYSNGLPGTVVWGTVPVSLPALLILLR